MPFRASLLLVGNVFAFGRRGFRFYHDSIFCRTFLAQQLDRLLKTSKLRLMKGT
jgi:hypothetical protein